MSMANKKYRIKLSVEERQELETLIAAGKAASGGGLLLAAAGGRVALDAQAAG